MPIDHGSRVVRVADDVPGSKITLTVTYSPAIPFPVLQVGRTAEPRVEFDVFVIDLVARSE